MTPLDRAFVKAYLQRDPAGMLPPQAARAVPLVEALGSDVVRRGPVPPAVGNARVLETLNRAPSPPKVKPSGSVPPPHFALRRESRQPAPEPPVCPAFTPGLQVEHFDWPKLCAGWDAAADADLRGLTEPLSALAQGAGKAIGVCAARRGEGATSVLLWLARRLALSGVKTIAVDFDLARPQMGLRLGLALESGWEAVLDGRQSLAHAVIESIADRMAVLPLGDVPASSPLATARMCDDLGTLLRHYEIVLVNLAPLCDPRSIENLSDPRLAERIGPLLVVCDVRNSRSLLEQLCAKASAAGIEPIVVVENFVAPEPLAASP